jgi:16S rRNA processing protein RimM
LNLNSWQKMTPGRKKTGNTGSPEAGEPVYLAVGFLRRPHGVNGEILMSVLTDFPERLYPGMKVFAGNSYDPFIVRSLRQHDRGALIAFEGLMDCDVVTPLRNKTLFIQANKLPELPNGEYYFHQLLGISVLDETGKNLGSLVEILETGANDVYLVKDSDGQEILLPAIDSVILKIDVDKREMTVRPQIWS